MTTRNRDFTRDDGTVLEVDFTIRGGVAQSYWNPGEPFEVEIESAWRKEEADNPNAPEVDLTDTEAERFEAEVNEDPASWEYEGDD